MTHVFRPYPQTSHFIPVGQLFLHEIKGVYSPRTSCFVYLIWYTVEPLTNDHPHQRPSLSYDHISCDGQWFLFVYRIPHQRPSLLYDHTNVIMRVVVQEGFYCTVNSPRLRFLDLSMTASASSVVISKYLFSAIAPCNWFSSSSFPSVVMLSRSVQCSIHRVLIPPWYVTTSLCPIMYLCFPFSVCIGYVVCKTFSYLYHLLLALNSLCSKIFSWIVSLFVRYLSALQYSLLLFLEFSLSSISRTICFELHCVIMPPFYLFSF